MSHDSNAAELSDEMVAVQVQTDAAYFTHIVTRYEKPLERYLRRLGVSQLEDREDLLQDIFLKVYRNINRFDSRLKFSSWIYRIAHNETISLYRKVSVRPEGHLVADPDDIMRLVAANDPSSASLHDEKLNAEVIHAALYELPEKYRAALVLRYFEHKEYDEISDILRIPVGTVGTLVHRGKQRLKVAIDTKKIHI